MDAIPFFVAENEMPEFFPIYRNIRQFSSKRRLWPDFRIAGDATYDSKPMIFFYGNALIFLTKKRHDIRYLKLLMILDGILHTL